MRKDAVLSNAAAAGVATHEATPARLVAAIVPIFDAIPDSILCLAARIFPAAVFWQSGQTKLDGFKVSDAAIDLFCDENRLPLIDPVIAAMRPSPSTSSRSSSSPASRVAWRRWRSSS